jgi:acetyltransferase-like isoleucine patch superfamily enzyme
MSAIRNFGRHSYDKDCISCYTYGYGDEDYYVDVGNFTSIAEGCNILLSHGHHHYNTCTNYHFYDCVDHLFDLADRQKTAGGGDVIIGNDVWIGRDVTVMSGITIGDGAVVATNSHVVHNVPPYAIIGGNPAKLIKYRFSPEIIDKFLQLKWWNLSDDLVNIISPLLQQVPTLELFDKIYSLIENNKDTVRLQDLRRDEITKVYVEILGRHPDKNGYEHYYNSNLSIEQIKHILMSSDEYQKRV